MKFKHLMFATILSPLLLNVACSSNKINRNTISNSMLTVDKVRFNNEVVFQETGMVTSDATVQVTVDAIGNRTVSSEGFKMTMDAKGNTVYDSKSTIYSGATIPVVGGIGPRTGFFSAFTGGVKIMRGPKDIAMEIANYHLIKKARTQGASALFLPSYEWEVKEDSETKSMFFGLFQTLVKQDITYTVKASAKTIQFIPSSQQTKSNKAKKSKAPILPPAE